jgi:dienelactone hydrolase
MTNILRAIPFLLATTSLASAGEVTWKMHTINAKSEFPACAAFDVDHDGDVDIYSGGWWYEAPTWKQHKVRDVAVIRGRYDDYSNQPMDCNGDGWTDIISVNYRSETIYWIEHPGDKLGEQDWTAHVIDKPGPSETGRLHDIDGDGDLDILPNGTTYAAWYEFKPEKKESGLLDPKWVKHDLPKEAAGHGIGLYCGDHGSQLLFPNGSLGLRRRGAQLDVSGLQPAIHLIHRDASVPIVCELNAEAEQFDAIWGRGHHIGLYASVFGPEKGRKEPIFAPIDTSWSQCHAPLIANIDNDGIRDIVAGKRYMGHEGNDPGEFDPLVIYWYEWDERRSAWRRHVIQENGPAGIDLDAAALDIDADGDVDLVTPSRHGLFMIENLLMNKQGVVATTWNSDKALGAYQNHSQLLTFANAAGDLAPVKSRAGWAQRRWHVLRAMEHAMGTLPSSADRAIGIDWAAPKGDKYSQRRAQIQAHADDPNKLAVTLLIPKGKGPFPAMLCLHPTSLPHGSKIVTGEVEAQNRAYAHELAERGYVCICPDYPTMGENAFDLKSTHKHYQSGTMKAIWDNVRCLDVLESLSYVDPDRIGVIGHSLGGHNGMFTACFDQRIKCVVTSCGFTPFHDYYGGKLEGWAQDRYMPRIRDVYKNDPDMMPFDFYEVLGAIAPRPVFINAPLHDDNFDVGGVKKAVAEANKVFDLLGQPKGIVARYPDCAHDFPTEIRQEAYEWLDAQLKK